MDTTHLHTLDFQKILGAVHWIRPILGITMGQLSNLFNILKGDNALDSPQSLTSKAKKQIALSEEAIQQRQLHRRQPGYPTYFHFLPSVPRQGS